MNYQKLSKDLFEEHRELIRLRAYLNAKENKILNLRKKVEKKLKKVKKNGLLSVEVGVE